MDNHNIIRELDNFVQRHNEAIDMINKFSKLFAINMFVHFTSSAIIICMSAIGLLAVSFVYMKVFES